MPAGFDGVKPRDVKPFARPAGFESEGKVLVCGLSRSRVAQLYADFAQFFWALPKGQPLFSQIAILQYQEPTHLRFRNNAQA